MRIFKGTKAVTARSTATPSASLKELPAETQGPQTDFSNEPRTASALSFDAVIGLILANLKLLLIGPLIVALGTFLIVSILPKSYTSVVYLNLDEAEARAADARMRSSFVLDKVLSEFQVPRNTLEARRRFLEDNLRIFVAPGETQKTTKLFRMEFSAPDPASAQKVNNLFLNAWLESTKPPPDKRATIEAEIERSEVQAKLIARLTDRLEKDATSLVAQSLQGELATPILNLIGKRDDNLKNIVTLKNSLRGVSRDVIFGAPDLPEEPSWPKRGIVTVLSAFSAGFVLLIFLFLRRFGADLRLRVSRAAS